MIKKILTTMDRKGMKKECNRENASAVWRGVSVALETTFPKLRLLVLSNAVLL
jgi:hypothetical protein